jgi:hypothetical protein
MGPQRTQPVTRPVIVIAGPEEVSVEVAEIYARWIAEWSQGLAVADDASILYPQPDALPGQLNGWQGLGEINPIKRRQAYWNKVALLLERAGSIPTLVLVGALRRHGDPGPLAGRIAGHNRKLALVIWVNTSHTDARLPLGADGGEAAQILWVLQDQQGWPVIAVHSGLGKNDLIGLIEAYLSHSVR